MKSFTVDLAALLTVAAGVLDSNGALLDANAGFLRLLPPDIKRPIGANVARCFIQPTFATLLSASCSDGRETYRGLISIGDPAGKTRTLRGNAWRTPTGLRVLAEYDVAELERLNDAMLDLNRVTSVAQHALLRTNVALKQREVQIVEASLTDSLTGVGNRRRLDQALTTELSRVGRIGGSLSAIMIDVDHFKRINDEYGHGVGDKVLARFGSVLRSQTRATDTVARYGGEEFMILMPHTALAQAEYKAELLRTAIAKEEIEPLTQPVTASFGVAELAANEHSASFLSRVDAALYQAKQGGRDRVVAIQHPHSTTPLSP